MQEETKDEAGPMAKHSTKLDEINLEQALVDFEIANARVVDLTARLTTLNHEVLRLRSENESLRLQLAQEHHSAVAALNELGLLKSSRAFRASRIIGDGAARLRGR
jgi:hypothetical protein